MAHYLAINLWNVLNVMVMAILCELAQNVVATEKCLATTATELDVRSVYGAMEEVEKNVSLVVELVETDVSPVVAADMITMVINVTYAGAKDTKIAVCAMGLVLIDVIPAGEMDMMIVKIAMALVL